MIDFRPMLAATAPDMTKLKFPLYASPKLDVVRCVIRDGVAVSRSLKPIPNEHVQRALSALPDGLDGELIASSATGRNVFTARQSAVMRKAGQPDFTFHVFDTVSDGAFEGRLVALVCEFARAEFNIGTGFSAAMRSELWGAKGRLFGKLARFKYQGLGPDGRPRFPVFLGFRDAMDC